MKAPPALPDLECACATIRRATRLVTQLYDAEFRGILEATQFSLLTVIAKKPGCNQAMIGRVLALDKTTLSRNLKLLERNGWIEHVASGDQRERGFVLSSAGKTVLNAAQPRWKRAQRRLRSAMTDAEWSSMFESFRIAAEAAQRLNRM